MQCKYTFKHIPSSEALEKHAFQKAQKLDKLCLHKEGQAQFIFSSEKTHEVEVLIDAGHTHITAKAAADSLMSAVDGAIHKAQQQLVKHKGKVQHHKGRTPGHGPTWGDEAG